MKRVRIYSVSRQSTFEFFDLDQGQRVALQSLLVPLGKKLVLIKEFLEEPGSGFIA